MAIYNNKHVVFEQVEVETDDFVWNQFTNTDGDDCYNNYDISDIRNTGLPTILLRYSNELYSIIGNTTIQTAKNGNATTLVSTSNPLFLPAGKEMASSPTYCVSQESDALITWNYWITHTHPNDKIKNQSGTSTAKAYWLRSPYSGLASAIVCIGSDGDFSAYYAQSTRWVAPCFAL